MLNEVKIILPAPPNRANATGHSFYHGLTKIQYRNLCVRNFPFMYTNRSSFPFKSCKWIGHAEVWNLYDYDNLMNLFKWPIDTLKHFGVIVDDGPKVCKPISLPSQTIKRVEHRVITIDLFRTVGE